MIDIQTEKFVIQAKKLTKEDQLLLKKILNNIRFASNISEINSSPLVGFPHLHAIDLGKYVVGIQVKSYEIVVAGIVEKGKEYTLFF